jgi:hypothetical protein
MQHQLCIKCQKTIDQCACVTSKIKLVKDNGQGEDKIFIVPIKETVLTAIHKLAKLPEFKGGKGSMPPFEAVCQHIFNQWTGFEMWLEDAEELRNAFQKCLNKRELKATGTALDKTVIIDWYSYATIEEYSKKNQKPLDYVFDHIFEQWLNIEYWLKNNKDFAEEWQACVDEMRERAGDVDAAFDCGEEW